MTDGSSTGDGGSDGDGDGDGDILNWVGSVSSCQDTNTNSLLLLVDQQKIHLVYW